MHEVTNAQYEAFDPKHQRAKRDGTSDDDHPVVREGLAAILQSQPDMTVAAEAADGAQTLELYDEFSPDVLILDLRMPTQDGLQVLAELMSRGGPKPRVLVMTTYDSEEDVRRALKAVIGCLVDEIALADAKLAAQIAPVLKELAGR